jgi:small subunit ribosomal protein S9
MEKKIKPKIKKEKEVVKAPVVGRFIEGIGRRKTSVARARLMKGSGDIMVNGMALDKYFQMPSLREVVRASLEKLGVLKQYNVSVNVSGGGIHAQAEAVRHGIARALVDETPEYKKQLRAFGFMTRDPRMVERKKYGYKKARRAPQWAKR